MSVVVSIVGSSGSGKTTLLEGLIPWLIGRGWRVAVLKHDAHRFEIDRDGKDTARLFDAGARQVAIAGPNEIALRERVDGGCEPEELVKRLFHDVDLVLTEGYKTGRWPKVEVIREGSGGEPRCLDDPTLRAVVSDLDRSWPVRAFAMDDVEAVGDWIENEFLGSMR